MTVFGSRSNVVEAALADTSGVFLITKVTPGAEVAKNSPIQTGYFAMIAILPAELHKL